MINIRRGNNDDVDWIVNELKTFSEIFSAKKSFFGDEEYIRNGMLSVMKDHFVLVATKDNVGLVGFIVGLKLPHFFNPNIKLLTEILWWVPENHRNTKAGAMLLKAFIEQGKKEADWITFGLNRNTPIKEASLLKRGFRLQETNYLMEVS